MTDPIIERLDQIKGRADKATEGPWEAEYSGEQGNCVLPPGYQSTREAVAVTRLWLQIRDAEFIAAARTDVPQMEQALREVFDLHKPEARYLVWGYEEVSFSSVEDAAEFVGQPVEAEEFKLCAECKRVEDGAADNAAEIGYETSLWPCPTYQAMASALGVETEGEER